MQIESDCKKWISAYIYFNGNIYSYECDKIILDVINPFLNECKQQYLFDKYFFIRYTERGSHIRLRFYGDNKKLTTIIKPKLETHIANFNNQDYFSKPILVNKAFQINDEKSIQWIEYVPEIERYGGYEAIKIAEDFFYCSSETTIKLLKQIKNGNNASRLGKGLLCMIVLLYVFIEDRNRSVRFINNYGTNYLSAFAKNENDKTTLLSVFDGGFYKQSEVLTDHVNTIWEMLNEKDGISEEIDEYSDCLIKIKKGINEKLAENSIYKNTNPIKKWDNFNAFILPSYIHMMNNRLGISIMEESYLAYLIKKASGAIFIEEKENLNEQ